MDTRIPKAQALFWRIERLRQLGYEAGVAPLLKEMARLHLERARELLAQGEADGWSDMYAAITAVIEAGDSMLALDLLDEARAAAAGVGVGAENVLSELVQLEGLAFDLGALPALRDFARPLPPMPRGLAA
jgi:hypothetical protein